LSEQQIKAAYNGENAPDDDEIAADELAIVPDGDYLAMDENDFDPALNNGPGLPGARV